MEAFERRRNFLSRTSSMALALTRSYVRRLLISGVYRLFIYFYLFIYLFTTCSITT